MDIRVLRYFLKISELGNISKAAESLHTTQPNPTQPNLSLQLTLHSSLSSPHERLRRLARLKTGRARAVPRSSLPVTSSQTQRS